MYAKLFASLYQGTLRGRSHEILVFTNLLAHCDPYGNVDKHFLAIAQETGLTLDEVKAALEILESPDPESRTPTADGARIQRMDGHRAWGWNIVNYGKYRSIRNEEDRRIKNAEAVAKYRKKTACKMKVRKSHRSSSKTSHAEGEGEVYSENGGEDSPFGKAAASRASEGRRGGADSA